MSFSSQFQPLVTQPPSTDDVKVLIPWLIQQVVPALNYNVLSVSRFSWPSPNSNVTALPGTFGVNYASGASVHWSKVIGSGNTGWVATA